MHSRSANLCRFSCMHNLFQNNLFRAIQWRQRHCLIFFSDSVPAHNADGEIYELEEQSPTADKLNKGENVKNKFIGYIDWLNSSYALFFFLLEMVWLHIGKFMTSIFLPKNLRWWPQMQIKISFWKKISKPIIIIMIHSWKRAIIILLVCQLMHRVKHGELNRRRGNNPDCRQDSCIIPTAVFEFSRFAVCMKLISIYSAVCGASRSQKSEMAVL